MPTATGATGTGLRRACLVGGLALLAGGWAAAPTEAQARDTTVSTQSAPALPRGAARLLDGRLSDQYSRSVRFQPPREGGEAAIPAWRGSYTGPWLAEARAAARRHGIPEDLFLRLVQRESNWQVAAVSSKGAVGLAQLMPGTAELLGVDIDDPAANLDGGARYLRMMHDRFGTWRLALAAYNAGPEAVERAGRDVPNFPETRAYVAAILGQ